MKNQTIAIIGSTGKTGARVQQRLEDMGLNVRGLSRRSSPSFDWSQPQQWSEALLGITSLYITYQPDLAVPQAEGDIAKLIETAKAVGVEHLVLLSGRGEAGAEKAEQQLQQSGLDWNVVRASFFMQNYSESFMLDGILEGNLVLPECHVNEPFIDADDIADMVVAALTKQDLRNQLFEVTGPESISFARCIELISQHTQHQVQFTPVAIDEYLRLLKQQPGLPEGFDWLINELFTEVLDGRNDYTTNTIETVLGRPATSFEQYIQKVLPTGAWKTQQPGAA